MHTSVLPDALKILRATRHDLHIALYSQASADQLEGLRQRSLDIALVSEPPAADDPDLDSALVLNDVMLLAMPEHHPLA
jgi:DNA-binding transcriptional LysR family regulator